MDKKEDNFLERYLNGFSPSGFEMQLGGQKIWIDYVKKYAKEIKTDDYGNVYAYYGDMDSEFTVLLDAHADEIGYVVFDITKEGFIKVARLGGSDVLITPASKCQIWGKHGAVLGIFGHPAIHVQDKFKVDIDNIFIDIACDTKEDVIAAGIEVGSPITMVGDYAKIGSFHTGRSLDDKIGGYINASILKVLHEKNIPLPFKLVVVNAVQEEVGLHGAKMASNFIKPNLAFVIDVTHCTKSPAYDINKLGTLEAGKGVVLMSAPTIQKNLLQLVRDIADVSEIPYQMSTSGRGTGTNADSYAYPNGIPPVLFKMAMRYMHTTSEMVHEDDVTNTIKLIIKTLVSKDITKSLKYTI
jgi:putative aminopeptidase FrvX